MRRAPAKLGSSIHRIGARGEALIIAERSRLMAEYPRRKSSGHALTLSFSTLRERANQDGGYSVVHRDPRRGPVRVKQATFEAR